MTLKTWREEFYPIAADQVPEHLALDHSLKKWEGLRRENLERHGLCRYRPSSRYLHDGKDTLCIDNSTCALRVHYLMDIDDIDEVLAKSDRCKRCPLYAANENKACHGYYGSQYDLFMRTGDPEPMIALLKKAEKKAKEREDVSEDAGLETYSLQEIRGGSDGDDDDWDDDWDDDDDGWGDDDDDDWNDDDDGDDWDDDWDDDDDDDEDDEDDEDDDDDDWGLIAEFSHEQ